MSGPSWRKVENENGFPFYINESTNEQQWDHPKYSDLKQRIDDCNYIRYASYRVASKFRVLQQALFLNDIPLENIQGVFDRHRLGATESSLCLESYDLEAVLSDIYFAANKHNQTNVDVDFASELTLTFLYNVFDKDRKSHIDVSSTKLTLAILSNCKLHNLYLYIFNLCADHNQCVTRLRLQSILSKICQILMYLNEDAYFGSHLIIDSLNDCYNNNPGLVGVVESSFIGWLETVPQLFSWLPVMHRFKISETVVHNTRCNVCKLNPIIGMKYHCSKCARYIQCQKCFLSGMISHSHKLSHTMREYCREHHSKKFCKIFSRKLINLIKCSYVVNENCVTDANLVKSKPISPINKECTIRFPKNEEVSDVTPLSSPLTQLQVIIRQLELQNRDLQQMLMVCNGTDKNVAQYLEQHWSHISTQIQKLKKLKEHMHTTPPTPVQRTIQNPIESTPMITNEKLTYKTLKNINFSPIMQEATEEVEELHEINKTYDKDINDVSLAPYSIRDISTWIGGQSTTSSDRIPENHCDSNPTLHTDLDDALAKLQQILANNFSLDESLGTVDNYQLKNAVTEVEGMLSSIIDNVEVNKVSTANIPSLLNECIEDRKNFLQK